MKLIKYCPKCKKIKFDQDFNRDRQTKDGRCGWCRICKRADQKVRYHADQKEILTQRAAHRLVRRLWFDEYRSKLSCQECGFSHPGALQFHHRKTETKRYNISIIVAQAYSMKTILKEIAKCDILCANCHSIHHFETRRVS